MYHGKMLGSPVSVESHFDGEDELSVHLIWHYVHRKYDMLTVPRMCKKAIHIRMPVE